MARRVLIGLAAFVALLAVTIASFYWITLLRGRAAWEQYERGARARGVRLTPAEWRQPPIPDAENFAAAPLLREVSQDGARKPFKFPGTRPPLGSSGAATDFEAWRRYCIEQKWIEPIDGESAAAATLRGLDIAFGDDWQQLRAAVDRPHCRFPPPEKDDWSAGATHLVPLLSMAQFAALRADVHLTLGDAPAAADDIHVLLRLAFLTREEPTLVSHLVRMSVAQLGVDLIKRGITERQWDEQTLTLFDDDLAEIRPLNQYVTALHTERAFMNQLHARLRINGAEELFKLVALEPLPVAQRLLSAYPQGWLYDTQRRINEATDALLTRVELDPAHFAPDRSPIDPTPKPASRVEAIRYFLFFISMPVFSPIEEKSLRLHTHVQCARAAIALERVRHATGSYPETLEAIGDVPRDVISGEPLRYRRDAGGGYVMYSVALNGSDDGGVESKERLAASQPDWVWSIAPR